MKTLSIQVPENLAIDSANLAEALGISRNEFIREAIAHEINHFHIKQQEEAIAKSFLAMSNDPEYLKESNEITNNLNTELPIEDNNWWKN